MRFLFDGYLLDTDRRELRRGSALLPVEPQVFDLLVFLVRNRDRVVSKDDLLASVWADRIVSESTLASRINAARRVIGDTGEQQRLIRTIIGKGVRFVGTVREQQDTVQSTAPPGVPRLSVVVLSFANFANDPEQDCLADCLSPLRWPSLHPYTRIMPFCQLLKKVSYERWTNQTRLPNSDAIPLPAVFRRSNFRCRTARRVHSSY